MSKNEFAPFAASKHANMSYGYRLNEMYNPEREPPILGGVGRHDVIDEVLADHKLSGESDQNLSLNPDHVVDAGNQCAYEFLRWFLLPRMRNSEPLDAVELATAATAFKHQFHEAHPKDFDPADGFELIPQAQWQLVQLFARYKFAIKRGENWNDVGILLKRAKGELQTLIKENDNLRHV